MNKVYIEISCCKSCPYYKTKRDIRKEKYFNHDAIVDVHYCVDREMDYTSKEDCETQFDSTIHKDCFIFENNNNTLKL